MSLIGGCSARARRLWFGAASAVALVGALLVGGPAVAPAGAAGTATPTIQLAWQHKLPDQNVDGVGGNIAQASPTVAQFPGGLATVVGDSGGHLWAYYLSNGKAVPGWPVTVGTPTTAPLEGPPSVDRLPGQAYDSVFVGTGAFNYAQVPDGMQAFSWNGTRLWATPAYDPIEGGSFGVEAGLTVYGTNPPRLFAGTFGFWQYAVNAVSGMTNWTHLNGDTTWSTAAEGDLYGNGQRELVVGGDSTENINAGSINGGRLWVLSGSGKEICQVEPQPTQVVQSSPAVGPMFNGSIGAVVGTGSYWPLGGDTDHLIAVSPSNCQVRWNVGLLGQTLSSPALADVANTPTRVQVVETTSLGSVLPGMVYELSSATGGIVRSWPATGPTVGLGGPATADLSGLGYQDIVVPTIYGTDVFDGRTGHLVTVLGQGQIGTQSTPLITEDPGGSVGITVAGYAGTSAGCPPLELVCLQGVISHYVVTSPGAQVGPYSQSWPMFHHDPHLTGDLQNNVKP